MLFQPFCGSVTSRGSLLSFWQVCCSAACPSWDGTLSLVELWASPICFPTDQAFYCQLLDMNFSPSALNQVSPLLQCNLLFFMVSPTQEEPELGVGMRAVPGRTLQTPNFLTHSLVFGDKFFSICCFAFGWLISRAPKWLFLFLNILSQILGREFPGLCTPPSLEIFLDSWDLDLSKCNLSYTRTLYLFYGPELCPKQNWFGGLHANLGLWLLSLRTSPPLSSLYGRTRSCASQAIPGPRNPPHWGSVYPSALPGAHHWWKWKGVVSTQDPWNHDPTFYGACLTSAPLRKASTPPQWKEGSLVLTASRIPWPLFSPYIFWKHSSNLSCSCLKPYWLDTCYWISSIPSSLAIKVLHDLAPANLCSLHSCQCPSHSMLQPKELLAALWTCHARSHLCTFAYAVPSA